MVGSGDTVRITFDLGSLRAARVLVTILAVAFIAFAAVEIALIAYLFSISRGFGIAALPILLLAAMFLRAGIKLLTRNGRRRSTLSIGSQGLCVELGLGQTRLVPWDRVDAVQVVGSGDREKLLFQLAPDATAVAAFGRQHRQLFTRPLAVRFRDMDLDRDEVIRAVERYVTVRSADPTGG